MQRSKATGVGLATVGACAALCVALWLAPAKESSRIETHPAAKEHSASEPRGLLTMSELHEEGWGKARPTEPAPAALRPEAESGLDTRIAEVLASDPQLQRFHQLRRKALRTSMEQQDYLDMIADENLLEEARDELLEAGSSLEISQEEELRRLQCIQYLNSALAWRNNPQRAQVIGAVTDVLLTEVPKAASSSAKGSMLGDKLDLFQILMMSDRAQAEALLGRARGTPLEKIFQLAWTTGQAAGKTQGS